MTHALQSETLRHRPCIVFAGGGTGGHVYPAVAVAEAILAMADVDVVFCGTRRGLEERVIPAKGWRLERLDIEPIQGGGPMRAVRGVFVAAMATARALSLVRSMHPRAVFSVGGYAAAPVSLAAALLRVPIAVMEPNVVVGLANRVVAPFARRAYVTWEETGDAFPARARRVLGVPLRVGFAPRPYTTGPSRRLLVLGGSQGAQALNERLPLALARIRGGPREIHVLHQAGRDRDGAVRADYARAGVSRVTVVPFVDDVAGEVAAADLVIARSGASTLAEITAIGRAALLVPFPYAANDHQGRNAEALASAGGALCIRQASATPERLAGEIEQLLADDVGRAAMATRSRERGKPSAASDVAIDLLHLAGISPRPRSASNGGSRHSGLVQEAR